MKRETWVIVANSAEARIFKVEKNTLQDEVATLIHPASRLHDRDIVGSRPGRAFDSMGTGRHALEPPTSPKENEIHLFAKELASHVETARSEGRLGRFYLIAGHSFLGLLRQAISATTLKLLAGEVQKDIVQMKPNLIREYLPPVL